MPREECDAYAADLSDRQRRGRSSVRRVECDLLHVLEERVEARAPEDPDTSGAQADRSFALPEEEEEELEPPSAEPEPEDEDEPLESLPDAARSPFFSDELFSAGFLAPSPLDDPDRLSVE